MNRIQGITRRVKPIYEKWYLRINNENVFEVTTISKRERNILNGIRKMMQCHKFSQEGIELTNRNKYIKNIHVSQEKLLKMKANDKFIESQTVQGESF